MTGGEYLTAALLAMLWADLDAALRAELAASKVSLQEFFKQRHPSWNLVGRVHFNLAENRRDAEARSGVPTLVMALKKSCGRSRPKSRG